MKRIALCVLAVIVWHLPASDSFAQKMPTGRYHPNRERSYDLLHYKGEFKFDFERRTIFGRSAIRLTPLRALASFSLDAIYLNVKSVTHLESNGSLPFHMTATTLDIALPQKQTPHDTFTVVIEYDAQPKGGMYFRRNPQNEKLFYVTTYGEGGLHANWLPIYNDVNDKFSTEMIITVPEPHVAISNGKLVASTTSGNERTFHWLQTLPHSNYLISLYVGDFEKGELAPAFGKIPLSYWVPRGRLNEGAFTFRNTTKMVEFFSNRFDYPYVWDKYDQLAIPDYAIGAMEHTGVTGHRANVLRDQSGPLENDATFDTYYSPWTAESLISHELAHHWFGNTLTCRNLSFIWLNESLASYLMMLWDEESAGKDLLGLDLVFAKRQYFDYVRREHVIRPLEHHYFDDANAIYNTEHTYLKGAAVLHMLRKVLGDENFFRAMSYYLHKHEFENVESHDLKIAIEEAVGKNLEWFFGDWITGGGGHPVLEVGYQFLPERKVLSLTVAQVQPQIEGQDLFTLPGHVTITTSARTWKEKIWIDAASESFILPCDEKPLMVSFDGEGELVAELRFDKEAEELAYQAVHDALPGRMWAMNEMATRYPTAPLTVKTFSEIIASNSFWGVRAEAALLLGKVRTSAAEGAATQALRASDYQVRKSAVLALAQMGTASAEQKLRQVIKSDANHDVVATAIVALAQANPKLEADFIQAQMSRSSWNDEIKIAGLRAWQRLAHPNLVATIKPYTEDRYNQGVVEAAFSAWAACAPQDTELHRKLLELTHSPVYTLQQYAIGALGRLQVQAAVSRLAQILVEQADDNLTTAARNALAQIRSVEERAF
jgi:aminopeptidase N